MFFVTCFIWCISFCKVHCFICSMLDTWLFLSYLRDVIANTKVCKLYYILNHVFWKIWLYSFTSSVKVLLVLNFTLFYHILVHLSFAGSAHGIVFIIYIMLWSSEKQCFIVHFTVIVVWFIVYSVYCFTQCF